MPPHLGYNGIHIEVAAPQQVLLQRIRLERLLRLDAVAATHVAGSCSSRATVQVVKILTKNCPAL